MPIGYICIDGMVGRMKDGSSAQSASSVNPLSDEPRFKPSTMTSQIIDTVVFIGIAFGIGFGWLFDSAMLPQLGAVMVGQYLLKFCLAAIDTPFFYLLTRSTHADLQTKSNASAEQIA